MNSRHPPDWLIICGVWFITFLLVGLNYGKFEGIEVSFVGQFSLIMISASWTFGVIGVKRLKEKSSDQYIALGRPQFFGSPYIRSTWAMLWFLFSLGYLRINDFLTKVFFRFFCWAV